MEQDNINLPVEQQFDEVIGIILQHKSRAARMVNEELLLTAWHVGKYVSAKLKSEVWGSKVVTQLSEYIRSKRPDIKGFSRRNIYNMVMFYDEYSSDNFIATVEHYLSHEFVQSKTAQIESAAYREHHDIIVQSEPAQSGREIITLMPKVLGFTTLTNHLEILSRCKSNEERLFYVLYSNKEHLATRELKRCISNQTFSTLLGSKKSMSKGMLKTYPKAPAMFKDTLFVDFLNLPQKHSESKLNYVRKQIGLWLSMP